MELVAFLGKDKETWGQISALVKRGEWDRAVLVKDKGTAIEANGSDFGNAEIVNINSEKPLTELKIEIMQKIRDKIDGAFEVALSLASGNGKEHMALISALLSIPVGVRLVVFTKNGIEFVN